MAKRWVVASPIDGLSDAAAAWGVPPIVAQLLCNRGLSPSKSGSDFLSPQLKDLIPPRQLPGATQAASLMARAIQSKKKIVLYGDYDVDGTTGVSILWHLLTLAGADVSFYVPHRIEEGYGLNLEAARKLVEEGAQLIVSIDCGITAIDVAAEMRSRGVSLIITDHHAIHDSLPDADAIVHPALSASYENPHLCGAGVAFKLAWCIAQELSGGEKVLPHFRTLLMELLPLAALGTIADVVPLVGENRIIAKHGLAQLVNTKLVGLRALMTSAGLSGNEVNCYDVGFKLAPRINAAGRMGHARLAVELMTRANDQRAREIAIYLEDHNRSRQVAERKIVQQACDMVEKNNWASDSRRAIVAASEDWHGGVIGIAAARLVERYHRPTVLISLTNGEGQGSVRGVPHFDIAAALAKCGEHLVTHGGHAMAGGLRLNTDRVDLFRDAFIALANDALTGVDLMPTLRLDAEVPLDSLALSATELILSLGPFGVGNPRPRLATRWVELAAEPKCVGSQQDHVQVLLRENGSCMRGIGFGLGSAIEDLKHHRRCRVAFEPMINEFNGRRSSEMRILDFQFPD